MEKQHDFTEGKLYSYATKIYHLLLLHFCLLLTVVPSLIGVLFLERSFQNLLLVGLLLIPVGPGIAATISVTLLIMTNELLNPVQIFWQKYQVNFKESLKIWLVYLASAVICLVDMVYLNETTYSFLSFVMLGLLVLATIIVLYALVLSVKFSFRTRDILKLSCFYTLTQPKISLKLMSYVIIALAVMFMISDMILLLGLTYLIWLCVKAITPVLKDVEVKFVSKKNGSI